MTSSKDEVRSLQKELTKARQEIHNIRTQLKTLQHVHRKDIDKLTRTIENWQCGDCKKRELNSPKSCNDKNKNEGITFKPIGVIKSEFPRIRGTPRQPTITINNTTGRLIFNKDLFTNPNHALQDLDQFSHMWIIFLFHENSTHPKSKVSPPRLNGIKTGVFATRSPHRPCPIGLSLVKIEKIVDNSIYFNGVDMIDQTPVLDIKPYIPHYDQPNMWNTSEHLENEDRNYLDKEMLQCQVNEAGKSLATHSINSERVDPNREEISSEVNSIPETSSGNDLRVPSWIDKAPVNKLTVSFEKEALVQLQQLEPELVSERIRLISNVLREDPRSVYLRKILSDAPYTWKIENLVVTCIFNNKNHTVKIQNICQAKLE